MATETKITDFDIVRDAIYRVGPDCELAADVGALDRIEASHSALEARLNAAVAALEAIMTQKPRTWLTLPFIQQAEAAIALAKGGAK